MRRRMAVWAACCIACSFLTGCGALTSARRTDELMGENMRLRQEITRLRQAKASTERELTDLEKAQRDLTESLQSELGEYRAKLEMTERGLVITFLAEVFFDSGKDALKEEGKAILQKVATVLNEDVIASPVAIDGHTDNDPIRYSGWKSNWELSSARALAVLHYFIDTCQVGPERLSANGYGEYRPVASNGTSAGKEQNRRVEIIILPAKITKVSP